MRQYLLLPILLLLSTTQINAFHIECPDDVTVNCTEELWDLSIYGDAYVYGYGNPYKADDPEVNYNLSDCNTGTITRTWTESDYSGNTASCTQTITVVAAYGGFDEDNIHWPENYMNASCDENIDPDSLPAPYDQPTYDDIDCSMPIATYDDMEFDFGGCKKILRKWKVIDCCNFHPNHNPPIGIWTHTQVIKIKPGSGPEISCIDDVTVSSGVNCNSTYVDLDAVTASSVCGSNVEITNDSPYADENGADASGNYPSGTTVVTFTANDGCGSTASCSVKITVNDGKKPSPVCFKNLSTTLGMMPDGYYVVLEPEMLDAGSFDNCTSQTELTFSLSKDTFYCEDVGVNEVELFVEDESGNVGVCRADILITDNMGMCPPSTITVSGKVSDVQGQSFANSTIDVNSEHGFIEEIQPDENGEFQYEFLDKDGPMTFTASTTDEEELEDLSTFDILLLKKHLVGDNIFKDAAQYVASDIFPDNGLTSYDLLVMHKRLLGDMQQWPEGEDWLMYNGNYHIEEEHSNPLEDEKLYEVKAENRDINIDFRAVKRGDISAPFPEKRFSGSLRLMLDNEEKLQAGQMRQIPITFAQAQELLGLQMSLQIDRDVITEIHPLPNEQANIGTSDFGMSSIDEGVLNFSWIVASVQSFDEDEALFVLELKANEDIELEKVLSLRGEPLEAEGYDENFNIMKVELDFTQTTSTTNELLSERTLLSPNPFSTIMKVQFPDRAAVNSVEIYNARGERVHFAQMEGETNSYHIEGSMLDQAGVYFLLGRTDQGQIMKKFIFR